MKKITFFFILFCTILNAQTEINNLSITDQAITEMQNENYTKAILMFDKAVKSNPKDKEALQIQSIFKI
jgi:Flp pilus assembly protein TadD